MRLIPLLGRYWTWTGAACLCLAAGACSSSLPDANPFADASSVFTKPDWATFSGKKQRVSNVVTAEDLVSADGTCASGVVVPAASPEPQPAPAPEAQPSAEPEAPATDGVNPRPSQNQRTATAPTNDTLLQPASGIALGLSECDVVRRAGQPERVELGNDERGERSVVLTYNRGERAGIYRFRQGRLFTIERVAVVEEPKPVKPKAPARRAAKPAPKQDAAAAPAPKTATPAGSAPQQQKPAAQNSPWPATPQQSPPQSTVWPTPPKPPSG